MASLVKRGSTFYAQYYLSRKLKRVSLHTDSLQIAKEKLRQLESSMMRGDGLGLPTPTPIAEVVQAYVEHKHKCGCQAAALMSSTGSTWIPQAVRLTNRGRRMSVVQRTRH